ncbi:S-type anion channel SLAH2-like isoform X1 [Cucurbita maxima]|uniref:S-type anion channel SLAH2-like isoform X1 n=1 Tax=Cucurbita maxima TaxID=3661 RepID=A0A6J1IDC8_CUCMA|nr:S-type anion channel SLAH2-like isoform X1 [Cucurbita maxima]XP_022973035.1 S-type anion channel SLAH2-like isoform X1 [Cucurbita maxima]
MENGKCQEDTPKELYEVPPLIKNISSVQVAGFDSIEECNEEIDPPNNPSTLRIQGNVSSSGVQSDAEFQLDNHRRKNNVSLSMPPSPVGVQLSPKTVFSTGERIPNNGTSGLAALEKPQKATLFHSQPIPMGSTFEDATRNIKAAPHPSISRLKDRRYDSFKTCSGKLARQLTILRGKSQQQIRPDETEAQEAVIENNLPAERYFAALEGPELETLRPSEEILLPDDKTWPFLLRFPISSFGMCLGVSSQAIMWKALASSASTKFLHLSLKINFVLWIISIALVITVASTYLLKVLLYFEAVRREYYHPIRVNFFFAPWIALLFLAIGVPPSVASKLHPALWYVLMTPFLCLELKIYGQWMSGGQRRLSKVANPTNHLSIVGNFVGALWGASMGLKEGPIFFFAIGMAHYLVLFVTLYQRLPTNATLPKELHPVFFLFIAAPSVASMALANIQGSFDNASRMIYFIAMFLYFSLVVRVNFFRGFQFSLAWWAYTFPMTGAAIATIRYSTEVTNIVTQVLAVLLSVIATVIVGSLFVTTIIHAFVYHDLFPNDIAIAISDRKPKPPHKNWFQNLRNGNSESQNIENFLKFSDPDSKDLEACVGPKTSEGEDGNVPSSSDQPQ